MPIYTYQAVEKNKSCSYCKDGFEHLQKIKDKALKYCPECKAKVQKIISNFSLGFSKSGFDQKAKSKGFHKLKRVDKGKYEKLY